MLHLVRKRTLFFVMLFSIIVLSFVFFGKHTAEPAITLNFSDEIWVITNPHYLSPSLQDNGIKCKQLHREKT